MPIDRLSALHAHRRALSRCRACEKMSGPPVYGEAVLSPVLLLGQAPGTREIAEGRPFCWTAGRTLFGWLAGCGLNEAAVRSRVYMSAVCRCFPGKLAGGGDRVPDRTEIANCGRWWQAEIALLEPQLIIAVGRLAIERFIAVPRLADVIGGGASSTSKEILINKGRQDNVLPGMAVLTADGIVGRIQASYPNAALVLLIPDPDSGVGVLLGGSRVRGVLKGRGKQECLLDYVDHEVQVEVGETVYTSGDDRIYPKGLRVGEVMKLAMGPDFQEIYVRPYAELDRLDEVLVVVAGVHEPLPPPRPQVSQSLLPLPPPDGPAPDGRAVGPPAPLEIREARSPGMVTEADRVLDRYRSVADAYGVRLGENERYTRAPDFNLGTVPDLPHAVEAPILPDPEDGAASSQAPANEEAP